MPLIKSLSIPLVLTTLLALLPTGKPQPVPDIEANTFSIVAFDPERNEWGCAVASKVIAVGSMVPFAKAGVGAVATQASVNVKHGPDGLDLLAKSAAADMICPAWQ